MIIAHDIDFQCCKVFSAITIRPDREKYKIILDKNKTVVWMMHGWMIIYKLVVARRRSEISG